MRSLLLPLATALVLVPASAAHAVYFPGAPADGPNADVVSLGGIAMSRDSDGHVLFLKREGGVPHVFVSFLAAGDPRQARRLDTGQLTASSQARISSSDNGRAAAVWINAGSLWSSVRPNGSSDWTAPEAVQTGGGVSNPSLSMGPSGAAYVTFEERGNLRAARLSGTSWTVLGPPLDIDPGRTVSGTSLSTSADGTAIAAWAEGGQVWTRRIVRTRLSQHPQEASVPSLDGRAAGGADSPSIDIEDDSSYAWVVLRQDFDGGSRVFARRLVGSEFGSPVAIDGGIFGVEAPDFDMSGRGRGLTAIGVRGRNATVGATMGAGDEWGASHQLTGDSDLPPRASSALAENGRGTIAWLERDPSGQPSIRARHWNARRFEDPVTLSDPTLGPVDADAGIDTAADSHGNAAAAYVQGTGADRRVMVAVFDREPRAVGGSNFNKWTRKRSFRLRWSKVDDPWGTVQYRVEVDGLPITTTTRTSVAARNLPDGAHVYNVVAVDSRGQATEGPGRALYVDTTAPEVELKAKKSKMRRPAAIELDAFDGEAIAGSGVASVVVRYGDGGRGTVNVPRIGLVDGAKLGYRYRKPGRYTVRVEVKDKAGNKRVATTRVVVGR